VAALFQRCVSLNVGCDIVTRFGICRQAATPSPEAHQQVARMKRSGIRETRGTDRPGFRKAPSGLCRLHQKTGSGGDEGMLDQIMRIIIIRIMEDASSWVP
jgi:hypothetical protein